MSPTVRVKVEVQLDDQPLNRGHCPIANALRRHDPDILSPRVDRDRISFSRRSTGDRYTYQAPRAAKTFIDTLDEGETPAPLVLTLADKDLLAVRPRAQRDPDEQTRRPYSPPVPGGRTPARSTLMRQPVAQA